MLRKLFKILYSFVGLLIGLVAFVLIIEVPISLQFMRDELEAIASEALGYQVVISGAVTVTTSLRPRVALRNVRIVDPGSPDDFSLRLHSGSVQLDAVSLLRRELRVSLGRTALRLYDKGKLSATTAGLLIGEPFFVALDASSLRHLQSGKPWIFRTRLEVPATTARLNGRLAPLTASGGLNLKVHAATSEIGKLHAWLGVSPTAAASLQVQAIANIGQDAFQLEIFDFTLGHTEITGAIEALPAKEGGGLDIALQAQQLALQELASLFPPEDDAVSGSPSKQRGFDLDAPVLPAEVSPPDMNLTLHVTRLVDSLTDFRNAHLGAELRNEEVPRLGFYTRGGGEWKATRSHEWHFYEQKESSAWVAVRGANTSRNQSAICRTSSKHTECPIV